MKNIQYYLFIIFIFKLLFSSSALANQASSPAIGSPLRAYLLDIVKLSQKSYDDENNQTSHMKALKDKGIPEFSMYDYEYKSFHHKRKALVIVFNGTNSTEDLKYDASIGFLSQYIKIKEYLPAFFYNNIFENSIIFMQAVGKKVSAKTGYVARNPFFEMPFYEMYKVRKTQQISDLVNSSFSQHTKLRTHIIPQLVDKLSSSYTNAERAIINDGMVYDKVIFAGHSLGGSLAQYAYLCAIQSSDSIFRYIPKELILFNSLGLPTQLLKGNEALNHSSLISYVRIENKKDFLNPITNAVINFKHIETKKNMFCQPIVFTPDVDFQYEHWYTFLRDAAATIHYAHSLDAIRSFLTHKIKVDDTYTDRLFAIIFPKDKHAEYDPAWFKDACKNNSIMADLKREVPSKTIAEKIYFYADDIKIYLSYLAAMSHDPRILQFGSGNFEDQLQYAAVKVRLLANQHMALRFNALSKNISDNTHLRTIDRASLLKRLEYIYIGSSLEITSGVSFLQITSDINNETIKDETVKSKCNALSKRIEQIYDNVKETKLFPQ